MSVTPEQLFQIIDAVDMERFQAISTDNPTFRFGNAPPAVGREAVAAAQQGFAATVAGMRHVVQRSWEHEDAMLVEGEVIFTRHDGSDVTIPFFDVFNLEGGKVRDTRIYMDAGPLFQSS